MDALKVYQALEILDRNGVLALSQAFFRKASVQILHSSQEVIGYLDQNPQAKELLFSLCVSTQGFMSKISPSG